MSLRAKFYPIAYTLGVRLSLLLLASVALAAPQFREHTIATDLKGGYQVVAADMNGDGKPDLIALASGMKELVWFENPSWKRHVIAGGFTQMINVAVIPGGGGAIPDLVLAHEFSNESKKSAGVISLLQHGQDPEMPWKVTEIDRLPTSHRLRTAIIDASGSPIVVNAPLTGPQAEGPDYRGHTPLVYYRPGEWKRRIIGEQNEGVVHGLWVMDWDGDGRDEILTASFVGIHLYKLERGQWRRTEISKGNPSAWPRGGASDLAVGQLGGRRFLCSIEPWHGNEVVVYLPEKAGWRRQVIEAGFVEGHTIITADLDGSGSDQIVAGYRGKGRSVYIYRASDASGTRWERQTLDDGGIAAAACAAADLNGDGRLDLACIGSATANLKWYENLGLTKSPAP